MSDKTKPNIITDAEFEKNSIKNMATRPTRPSAYGASALSPEQVKERFDKNPEMLKDKINELIGYLPYLAPDVNVEVGGTVLTLAALCASIAATNGVRMQDLLKVDYGAEVKTLAEAFAALIKWLTESDEKRENLSGDLDDAVDRIDNAEREIKAAGDRIDELSDVTLNLNYILSNDGTYYICDGGAVVGDIVIPSSCKGLPVKEINNGAFYGDRLGNSRAITSVIIPATIQRIGDSAFAQQWSLGKIVLKGTPEIIDLAAFDTTSMAVDRGEEAVECNLYVPFGENEVDGAPWGITGTIHYNVISDDASKVPLMSVIDEKRLKDFDTDEYYFSEKNWNKFIGENNRAYVELYQGRGTSGMYALRETEQPLRNAWYSKEQWAKDYAAANNGAYPTRAPNDNEYPTIDSIAQRSGDGHLNVPPTPYAPNHAVPYQYVAKLENRLLALESEMYEGTEGLEYALSNSGSSYDCISIGTVPQNTDIKIATYIDGIPVESILSYAFGSAELKSVTIPVTLRAMNERAFNGAKVSKVYIRDLAAWCQISFGGINASPITQYNNATVYVNQKPITELVIPNTVTVIKTRAFAYWSQITSLKLPDYCTGISSMAFQQCNGLTEVVLPASLQWTEVSAFGKCGNLKKVKFKGSPTSTVHARLFEECYNLTDIYVPWSEGAIKNAPWGANNATIHYNHEV